MSEFLLLAIIGNGLKKILLLCLPFCSIDQNFQDELFYPRAWLLKSSVGNLRTKVKEFPHPPLLIFLI